MSTVIWIIVIALVLAVLWIIGIYNGLIRLKNRVDEAWADIDVQLKRRYDLIPNLVETVKGYAAHEKDLFEKVTQARTAAMNAQSVPEHQQAENMLSGALKTLFAVSENYPDLKANENFAKLQDELSDTENKIQASRRFYNSQVRDYNTKIEVFPNNVFAGMFHFTQREMFDIDEAHAQERENVRVSF